MTPDRAAEIERLADVTRGLPSNVPAANWATINSLREAVYELLADREQIASQRDNYAAALQVIADRRVFLPANAARRALQGLDVFGYDEPVSTDQLLKE